MRRPSGFLPVGRAVALVLPTMDRDRAAAGRPCPECGGRARHRRECSMRATVARCWTFYHAALPEPCPAGEADPG